MFLSGIDLLTESSNIWFLDCACSNHMACARRLFQSIEVSNTNEVRMGDDKTEKIEDIGKIKIQKRFGENKVLKDVYYVPKFTHNLLRIEQLIEWGYTFNFYDDQYIIGHKKRNMPPIFVSMVG